MQHTFLPRLLRGLELQTNLQEDYTKFYNHEEAYNFLKRAQCEYDIWVPFPVNHLPLLGPSPSQHSVLNVKVPVGAFNQEKTFVRTFVCSSTWPAGARPRDDVTILVRVRWCDSVSINTTTLSCNMCCRPFYRTNPYDNVCSRGPQSGEKWREMGNADICSSWQIAKVRLW